MPELPEVETVRRGLERHVTGRAIDTVRVLHPRAVRRHLAGPADFEAALAGRSLDDAKRRGKYLWLSVGEDALLAHLGMSGQLLVGDPLAPLEPHLRARFAFTDAGTDLRFVYQRTFGHLMFSPGGAELPEPISHIAPDPLEAGGPEPLHRRDRRGREPPLGNGTGHVAGLRLHRLLADLREVAGLVHHPALLAAHAERARLAGAKIDGASLRGARLVGADLRGASLVNCDLMDADLGCSRIDFREVNESRNQCSKLSKTYQLIFQFGKIAFDAAGELIYGRALLKILMFQPREILR